MIFKKSFILVISLLILAVPAYAEIMQKPAKVNIAVNEGILYNSNPGYASTPNRDHDWANQMGASLSIELPFGEIHKYSFNSNTSWVKYFSLRKFNQVNNNISHAVDFTFNRWMLNIHQNFDSTAEPNENEVGIPSNTLLRKRVNVPGFAIRGDLGKLKLSTGFDYTDYNTNDDYKMLARKVYTPYIESAFAITPLLDGYARYTYSRTIRKHHDLSSSYGNDVKVGLRGELTRYLAGEIGVGYDWLTFDSNPTSGDTSDYSGITYSGSLSNRLSKLTTQTLSLSLNPEQGYNVGNYYTYYITGYKINHTLNNRIDVNASVTYTDTHESGGDYFKEKAHIWQYGGGFNYKIAKQASLSLDYSYGDKVSNKHGKGYKQQSVSTRINYTF
jgi:hypothetical protein